MGYKHDIINWMRTTYVEYPGLSGPCTDGAYIALIKFLDGRFVIKVGGVEKFSGEDLDEAIGEYHKFRGFPSGEPGNKV